MIVLEISKELENCFFDHFLLFLPLILIFIELLLAVLKYGDAFVN